MKELKSRQPGFPFNSVFCSVSMSLSQAQAQWRKPGDTKEGKEERERCLFKESNSWHSSSWVGGCSDGWMDVVDGSGCLVGWGGWVDGANLSHI